MVVTDELPRLKLAIRAIDAITVTLMFPEIQLSPAELAGP
jgi:hypothetical protein